MTPIKTAEIQNQNVWELLLSRHPESNFLQSWHWGEFHRQLGNQIIRTGFYRNDQLVGIMLLIVEAAKRARYLVIPGGPIFNWSDKNLVSAFQKQIIIVAHAQNCAFVRVRPQLLSTPVNQELFRSLGFVSAPMHLHAELTSVIDITQPEAQILKNMRKNTRHEVRRAEKIGIKVRVSTDPQDIKSFHALQLQTARRHKFVPFSDKYLSEQFRAFAAGGQALLYGAYFQNQLLAQAFIIFCGQEAVYHYGTSTSEGRQYPGAYLIQWQAIKEARVRGLKRYNLWGITPAGATSHRFYGVSLFKRGFGGKDIEYLHAQDLVINHSKYLINYLVEKVRKTTRGL